MAGPLVTAGLAGIGVAVLCVFGFVAATVRADGRPGLGTSRLRGAPAVWAGAAVATGAGSFLWLVAATVDGWNP